ncbi:hypothetical protein Xsto_04113 [Xenorhabdus stockiae]|uniref:Uncharacterized protein n=1 Tax=Xenorhabdus stockiae TaxID=351614 RepID=A0A2D0K5A5_9GAMM|nr:hypothetical protein [Xenorhabdus stockiae]PHM58550.1 hypothetical protein Xsto_04113 [Xenorhabdus stockiae]
MNTCDSSTYPPIAHHENIVKAFCEYAAVLPESHEQKWLMLLLADSLKGSFTAMRDYLLSDEDL